MPNPSNASASSFDRHGVAADLYLKLGAADTSQRCDLNTTLGELDLGAEILARLHLTPGEHLLDIACGTGQHLARFVEALSPDGTARGFDFNPDAIAQVLARGLDGTVAPGDVLPVENAAADVLTCNYAIYYFDDLAATLAEWARVLKSGGRLLVTAPAGDTNAELYAFHQEATGHAPSDADQMALGYTERLVVPALPAAGFTEIQLETLINPITFPDRETFLDYWTATSLFRRTPEATREQGARALSDRPGAFVVTKRVTVLQARRR